MDPIQIIVVDDHPLFRQGVVDSLSMEGDFDILGQTDNGEKGLELIRKYKPHVAVVDVNLPGINGQQITKQARLEKIPTRIILLTAYDDVRQKNYAMRAGACAFCTKDIEPELLIWVVRRVAAGSFVVDGREMSAADLAMWLQMSGEGDSSVSAERYPTRQEEIGQPLSVREMEVLGLVTRGLSNKEIATSLGISHQTVKNHITAILRKLGLNDRTQAAVYALQQGWVRLYQSTISPEEQSNEPGSATEN
jgi:DNA-binding NarL/FixJ family response regulator